MAEFCFECFQKTHSNYKRRHVVLEWDLCEGCGKMKECVVAIRYKPFWGFEKTRKDIQSAKIFTISTKIEEAIFERHLVKALQYNDVISFDYFCSILGLKSSSLAVVQKYSNDLFAITKDGVRIIANNDLLSANAQKHLKNLIARYVYPSQYLPNTFEFDVGKNVDYSYFNQAELSFLNEIIIAFTNLLNIVMIGNIAQFIDDKTAYLYNSLNFYGFNYTAWNIYNGILQGKLHARDNITEVLEKYWELRGNNKLMAIGAFSNKYEWFFELKNSIATLRCDIETNRKLFIMNFINTIIFQFRDTEIKTLLLKHLHIKYGLLRKK